MTYLLLFVGLSLGTLFGWMLCAVLVKNRAGSGARNDSKAATSPDPRVGPRPDVEPPAQSRDHGVA